MSRYNINTLQQLAYTGRQSDLQTYSDQYLKQALANLGQRFSIKGDGVTNGRFFIYELMPDLPVPVEEDFEPYGKLYDAYMMATVNSDEFGWIDIDLYACQLKDGEGEYYSEHLDLSDDDYITNAEDIYMPGAKVQSAYDSSPVAYYGKGGLLTRYDDNVMKTAFQSLSYDKGLLDGSFNDYDIEHGRISSAVRVHKLDDEYILAALSYSYTDTNKCPHYVVSQYKMSPEFVDSTQKAWDIIMDPEGPVLDGKNKYEWTGESIIEVLGTILEPNGSCEAIMGYDTHNICCDSDEFEEAFGSNTKYGDSIEADVLQWNESLAKEMPFFKSIYNEEAYFGTNDNLKLKRRLVAEILAGLYKNYLEESGDPEAAARSEFIAIMPYEYEFIYTCNSLKPEQIYSSSRDVTVESTKDPMQELWKISQTGNRGVREQIIVCTSWNTADTQEDIYSIWKYFITYDKDDLVNDIAFIRMYVMPYVNDDGYWNINNVDTSIYARGKDGGQPSVIISYSDTYIGTHQILSTMHKDELVTALDWDIAEYHCRPLDTSTTIGAGSFHMMTTYMPVNISTAYLADNLVTFLENAIIMDVASVHNEDVDQSTTPRPLSDPTQLGDNATITTFWALTKDKETYEYYFSYVKQPDTSWAVDFNYLTDAEAIVRYYMQLGLEPDLYKHSWVVFDGVESTLKNQAVIASNTMAYPVLMNRMKDNFADMFDFEQASYQYLNNLNFMLAFHNNVEFNGSYIRDVHPENTGRGFFRFDAYSYSYIDIDGITRIGTYAYVPSIRAWRVPGIMSYDYYPNTRADNTYDGDWWLDTLLPILDLKETFVRNINAFNRYNILSTDEAGRMFYAYIGTTSQDGDKGILHLGTATEDINLGLYTLTQIEERQKFMTHHELDVDFKTIMLNGDVVMPKGVWTAFRQEGNPERVMFSTLYQLAYISNDLPSDVSSLREVAMKGWPAAQDRIFRIKKAVSKARPNIGNMAYVPAKDTYVSYLNLSWLAYINLQVEGITPRELRNLTASINGDPSKLFYLDGAYGIPTYFLQLTTDILDNAERLYDADGAYYIKLNPLTLAYTTEYDSNGRPMTTRLNVREEATTHSTAYAMYDGGELQWED